MDHFSWFFLKIGGRVWLLPTESIFQVAVQNAGIAFNTRHVASCMLVYATLVIFLSVYLIQMLKADIAMWNVSKI